MRCSVVGFYGAKGNANEQHTAEVGLKHLAAGHIRDGLDLLLLAAGAGCSLNRSRKIASR